MEKADLIKVVDEVKQKNLKVDQLTTDEHLQIKKYLREQDEGIKDGLSLYEVTFDGHLRPVKCF